MDDELVNLIDEDNSNSHQMLVKNGRSEIISLFENSDSEFHNEKILQNKDFVNSNAINDTKDSTQQNTYAPTPPLLTAEKTISVNTDFDDTNENVDCGDEEAGEGLIRITILEEGHLRLSDAYNHTYFFPSEELQNRNINVNALTDENIQEIIQIAMPQLLNDEKFNEETNESIIKQPLQTEHSNIEEFKNYQKSQQRTTNLSYYSLGQQNHQTDTQQSSYITTQNCNIDKTNDVVEPNYNYSNLYQSSNLSVGYYPQSTLLVPRNFNSTNNYLRTQTVTNNFDYKSNLSDVGIGGLGHVMIGEEMQVRNSEGRIELATVRYYRPGTGYKIQFADGHFEWLHEASVLELKHYQQQNFNKNSDSNHNLNANQTHNSGINENASSINSTNLHYQQSVQQQKLSNLRRFMVQNSNNLHSNNFQSQNNVNTMPSSSSLTNSPKSLILNNTISHQKDQRILQRSQNHFSNVNQYEINSLQHQVNSNSQSAYRQEVLPPSVPGMRVSINNDSDISNESISNYHITDSHQTSDHQNSLSYCNKTSLNYNTKISNFSENFYCSICDKHCNDNEASYIVLRIPACISCASLKVAIIDDEELQVENAENCQNESNKNFEERIEEIVTEKKRSVSPIFNMNRINVKKRKFDEKENITKDQNEKPNLNSEEIILNGSKNDPKIIFENETTSIYKKDEKQEFSSSKLDPNLEEEVSL